MKAIEIDNLAFSYSKKSKIFENFSLQIKCGYSEGYVYGLMGASGSGKSTLLKLLLGIETGFQGVINFTPHNLIISYVPQEAVLFEHLSIKENGEYLKNIELYENRFDQNLFDSLTEILDLRSVLKSSQSVLELSGGQKQKLSLLRALSVNPDILFLDEPCNGLDAEVKRQFLFKLRKLIIDRNILAIYVTHHKSEALIVSDEVIYLTKDTVSRTVVNKVQEKALRFITHPPSFESAQVFRFPDYNSLQCSIVDGLIGISEANKDKILFDSDSIKLSNEQGFEYEVINQNEIYSQVLVHPTKALIILKKPKDEVLAHKHFYFDGRILLYNENNFLENQFKVVKNKINGL